MHSGSRQQKREALLEQLTGPITAEMDVEWFQGCLFDLATVVDEEGSDQSRAVAEALRRLGRDLRADTIGAVVADAVVLARSGVLDRPAVQMPAGSVPEPVAPPAMADDEISGFASDPELGGMFVADALEHLGTIESVVLKLETAPNDATLLNDLFRPFHTVKGNAGVIGLMSIQEVAHRVETLLDLARSGLHAIGPVDIEVVLAAVDLLTLMTHDLPARADGQLFTDVTERRRELLARIDRQIAGTAAGGHAAVVPSSASPAAAAERGSVDAGLPATEAGLMDGLDPMMPRRDDGQSTVKVNTQKLDSLVDLVGELVIAQSILTEGRALAQGDERLARQFAQVKRITSELQRQAMAMRMVPIRQTFQKMSRLVSDLARKSGKAMALKLSGEDTELDRKVVEQITDPLMHMVRNMVDHGVESAAVRQAAGKPSRAEFRLSAYHQAGAIVVEVADDGAGLDTDRILTKARALGMVQEDESLAPEDIHQLIFRPGFSTTDRVTETSGRGVGMDVVRRNIEELRGRVDITTTRGVGTTFTLRLPLTLATVDGLMLSVGAERFVIPIFAVRESLRPTRAQVHTIGEQACVIQVRERLIPALHLGRLWNIPGAQPDATAATVVIVEDNGAPIALVVDDLLGKQAVVIKGLGASFQGVHGIAGGAILGDGRIGLILDVGGLRLLLEKGSLSAVA